MARIGIAVEMRPEWAVEAKVAAARPLAEQEGVQCQVAFERRDQIRRVRIDAVVRQWADAVDAAKARHLGSDGRHEAWYDLLAPKGLPAKGAAGITGSVQIWAQTRRSESELKQQDQKNKRSGTRKANNYIAVAQKAQRSTM